MNKEVYYTYQEVLNVYPLVAPEYPQKTTTSATWFTSLLSSAGIQFDVIGLHSNISNAQITTIVNCLMNQVYNRNAFNYLYEKQIGYFDTAPTLNTDDFKKAMLNVVNILNLTLPKYIPLLIQFEKASENPVTANVSEVLARNRFNDTPQNGGDYNNDNHATTVTESSNTQKLEIGTLMERLAETYKNFRSIILDWSNEFNKCFLLESQL